MSSQISVPVQRELKRKFLLLSYTSPFFMAHTISIAQVSYTFSTSFFLQRDDGQNDNKDSSSEFSRASEPIIYILTA